MKKSLFVLASLFIILIFSGLSCPFRSQKEIPDGGVFKSEDAGETWQQKIFVRQENKETVTIGTVDIATMVFDPQDKDIIYIGTAINGIYKTIDAGETWQPTPISSGYFSSIAIDPKDSKVIYTVSGREVFKSIDGGENWRSTYLETREGRRVTSINVDTYDPAKIYITTDDGGIIKSTDFGENWHVLTWEKFPIRNFYINQADTRIIYILTDGIYKSTDGGETWRDMNGGLKEYEKATNIHWLLPASFSPDILYLGTDYGVLRSEDGGETWQPIQTLIPFKTLPVKTVAVNPQNSQVIYATVDKTIYKTEDGGYSWKTITTVPTSRKINFFLVNPINPSIVYVGVHKGVED